uniref:hypothetical protein n=1 Tax=Vibrio cholerae TaxID=666 RepID=UPI00301D0086
CGATLTWDYFHPNADRPLLLTHIEDRDIWTWTHRNSKQFLAGLDLAMGNYTDDMVDTAMKYFHDLFYVHTVSDANISPVYERLFNSGKP